MLRKISNDKKAGVQAQVNYKHHF